MNDMNTYEEMQDRAYNAGIDVVEYSFRNKTIKGLYCDGTAAISNNIDTNAERACILAEEMGHHYTSAGNIIDQTDEQSRKQEFRARMWAYNEMVGLMGIVRAFHHGCRSTYEVAEYLEVTEEFLNDTLNAYRDKYGVYTTVDNYIIYFIPGLTVFKKE